MIYYHGTNSVFDQFNINCDVRPDAASNGHLGVWLTKDKALAQRFGRFCLEVEVRIDKAYDMSVSELSALHRCCQKARDPAFDRHLYIEKRRGLIADGFDFINIVEVDGRSDMGVCLVAENLSVIGCEPPL